MDAFGAENIGLSLEQIPKLYKKYFIDTGIERSALFDALNKKYIISKVLYPGSFAHITPSFYYPEVVYLDMDKRCRKFYSDIETIEFIKHKKVYDEDPIIRFYESNFENNINEENEYFDLLISQYSGFISKYCTKHLKHNGLLLANDSHGDATFAYNSGEYGLAAVVNNLLEVEEQGISNYFKLKNKKTIDLKKVLNNMKGPNYIKNAYAYIFIKK